jgi:hypothetical protein
MANLPGSPVLLSVSQYWLRNRRSMVRGIAGKQSFEYWLLEFLLQYTLIAQEIQPNGG